MSRRDPYLYEDAPVLKNLPGIKNIEELNAVLAKTATSWTEKVIEPAFA